MTGDIKRHESNETLTFSLAITPSLDQEMLSGSVDAGFVLALLFHHGDLEPDCVGASVK